MSIPRALAALCVAAALSAQRPALPPAESFSLPELTTQLDAAGRAWLPFLSRRSLACGVYRLAEGATDHQTPHAHDEVYYVVAGRAQLAVGARRLDATPGAVLYVAAGAEHRFVDITADLTALVFFSHAAPTRGGMAGRPAPTEQTPYDESSERGLARIFFWFGGSSAGQLAIDFGRPAWSVAFDAFTETPSERRWRFGENFWTTLDTNIPLTIGGADVPVGQYYLVLQNHPEHGLRILALDPAPIRARRLDAWQANETEGGIAIPVLHTRVEDVAERLEVELRVEAGARERGVLTVRFGPHRLEAPVVLHAHD
ncbi:MAG: cupin domain-containing protein [Planctomycetes bacterium]|nr:cupin domain-containing protein [Planctomycetota bacterium]